MRLLHAQLRRKLPQLSSLGGLPLLVWALLACRPGALVPKYVEPAPDEPHAIVKLRTLYAARPGANLDELVTVDGDRLDLDEPGQSTRTNGFRVRPGFASVSITSDFFDTETHVERQSYQASEQYYCGTQQSGFGAHKYTTSKYCTRYVTKYRDNWVTVRLPRGACGGKVNLAPHPGDVYLLQYTFSGPNSCELTCVRQHFTAPGQFQNTVCEYVSQPAKEDS
ncbi:MAG: hypothetical protein H6718_04000 [Polyangiaceae bacterium]|nr:hypothetical protein [Myxococcales bacterium]MCB9584531.1 hypothetical protein [Polyangiaceae bacterium]